MSVIGDVFGVGGISNLATTILNKFVKDPEARDKALEELRKDSIVLSQMQADLEAKLNETAGQNIRAEMSSGDKYTERSRPTFMYIIEAILAANYILFPVLGSFGLHITPLVLPPDLLTLFGVCVTGYVMARSVDKTMALPGDSQVNSPLFGKISNSSPK